jgi:hypothetical protein
MEGSMIVKPIDAELDYPIAWELSDDESIVTADYSIFPVEAGGVSVKNGSAEISADATGCLLQGGIDGHLYEATAKIVTSFGRRDARTITIRIGVAEAVQ